MRVYSIVILVRGYTVLQILTETGQIGLRLSNDNYEVRNLEQKLVNLRSLWLIIIWGRCWEFGLEDSNTIKVYVN